MLNKFQDLYHQKIRESLKKDFNFSNIHQIPSIEKVTLNMGVGKAALNSKLVDAAFRDLTLIAAQKPVITKAKKSISTFKLRAGMNIGCKVTLRGTRMYEFLERLVLVALPRVKEFSGFSSKSFDGKGNFTFGIKDHTIFPEINYDDVDSPLGLDITIVTSASEDKHAKKLLESFYIPFYK